MKVLAIIQARLSSTRLPGKVLLPLGGKTVLENVYERVSASKLIDKTIIATTVNPADDELVELCEKKNIEVFRGSEDDVLDRFYQVAKQYQADNIIRITADCPLLDPKIIDQVISLHFKAKNDYTANAYYVHVTYPDGEDVEIFSFDVLQKAWQNAKLIWQREHATQYITQNPELFQIGNLSYPENLSDKRWTLDEPNDYSFIEVIYKALYKDDKIFGMQDILKYLKDHPEVEKINQHIVRNEGLIKSLKQDGIIEEEK